MDYARLCGAASGVFVERGFNGLAGVQGFESILQPKSGADNGAIMAAEQIAHLVEGWRYASSAVSAYLNNSKDGAIHFAYYAELRAAMSLLSWSGIRVRYKDYWYLDSAGRRVDFNGGQTHTAVWAFWREWVKRQDATDLFLNGVRVTSRLSLGDVVDAVAFVDPSAQLRGWGGDLVALDNDHDSRNRSSYETPWVGRRLTKIGSDEIGLVSDLWRAFISDSVVMNFDSSLARHIVGRSVSDVAGDEDAIADKLKRISARVSGATGESEEAVLGALGRHDGDLCNIFELAASPSTEAENVLCRAFCLLRVAMLAMNKSISSAQSNDGAQWIKNWLDHAGIWSDELDCDVADIEIDYEIALDEFKSETFSGALWNSSNLDSVMRMTRPDACLAWNLSL